MIQEKGKRFQKLLRLVALGLPELALAAAMGAGFVYWSSLTTPLEKLKTEYPVVVWKGEKEHFQIEFHQRKPVHWVRIPEISPYVLKAVLLSEDSAFYQHEGIDFEQLRMAIDEALDEGGRVRGASTITQQVVKNVFLTQERSVFRKIREMILAPQLEKKVGKQKILETYFNIAEWGPNGIFGIFKASRYYFQKHPSELSPKEAAFLAMLLPSPRKYSVSYRQKNLTDFARRRVRDILGKMLKTGVISEAQYEVELDTPLSFEIRDPNRGIEIDGTSQDRGE